MKKERIISQALAFAMLITLTGCSKKENSLKSSFSYLEKIKIPQKYESYFPGLTDIENMLKQNKSVCTYDIKEKLNSAYFTQLAIAIEQNSSLYLRENLGLTSLSSVGASHILEHSLQDIFLNANNEVNEDICLLKDLVIAISNEPSPIMAKYLYKENIIIIYLQEIESFANKEGISLPQAMGHILKHELSHVRQTKCRERNFEIYEEPTFNSYSSFLIEASAESSLYNLGLEQDFLPYRNIYENEKEAEALLFLLGLTSPSLEEYYNALFDADYVKLFSFWHADDTDKIYIISQILYLINTSFNQTTLAKDLKTRTLTGENDKLKLDFSYELAIFELALKNLAEETRRGDISLKENILFFCIIKETIKTSLIDKFSSDNEKKYLTLCLYYEEFLKNYYDKAFEEILSMVENNENILKDATPEYNELKDKYPVIIALENFWKTSSKNPNLHLSKTK